MGSGGFSLGTSQQPKAWKDLTETDRIERLRSIVKNMRHEVSVLYKRVDELTNLVTDHSHASKDGTPMVPISTQADQRYQEQPTSTPSNPFWYDGPGNDDDYI